MALRIEDYGLIGNTHSAALVGMDGSIDWLCMPRFDSAACFAALLGDPQHGRWRLAPKEDSVRVRRSYEPGSLVLATEFETGDGRVRVRDCMPVAKGRNDVVRVVQGLEGTVEMALELEVRFDYGRTVPWLQAMDGGVVTTAGPHALRLHTPVRLVNESFVTRATFQVSEGQAIPFTLSYFPSHESPPAPLDGNAAIDEDLSWWRAWIGRSDYKGGWREQVERSLITLKALTYAPTGGVVAAPTTSLPEHFGGMRNWDYRLCWLRDATLTLYALLNAGYHAEARAWREWLLRAAAGRPQDIRILYGIAGERDIRERTLEHLPGYQGAYPVRTGNAAADQFQLDVYGEVMDTLHVARAHGLAPNEDAWELQRTLLDFLESNWDQADNGIWEVRGPKRHFTHSKVMVWVALDRAIRGAEQFGLEGPIERWSELRDQVHRQVCERGYDAQRNTFTQYYGGTELDASLLQIPLVGFLPGSDRRVEGTLAAIENDLLKNGFLLRYIASEKVEDFSEDEGVFLPCSFWLADNYALLGRRQEAAALFERLLGLTNDLGLISEEYDPDRERLLGNFPQAFTHVALINTARNLSHGGGPNERRGANAQPPAVDDAHQEQ